MTSPGLRFQPAFKVSTVEKAFNPPMRRPQAEHRRKTAKLSPSFTVARIFSHGRFICIWRAFRSCAGRGDTFPPSVRGFAGGFADRRQTAGLDARRGGERGERGGLDHQLGNGTINRKAARAPLVPNQAARTRARETLVRALRALDAAVELDAGDRRSLDHDRGRSARTLVVVPADRHDCENGALCRDCRVADDVTPVVAKGASSQRRRSPEIIGSLNNRLCTLAHKSVNNLTD